MLVTGASGYIATHIVQQLQKAGYKVRGTVRYLKNEEKLKPLQELCPDAKYPLELVEADLTKSEGWVEAVTGCKYVMHVASPFPAENPANEDEIIKPAVDGTLYVMKACQEAKCVKRVVLTSSVVAVCNGFEVGGEKEYTENDWTDHKRQGLTAYTKSKTLAEKAAWDFVEGLEEEEKFELVVMNPAFVMGPVLCGSFTTSMEVPKRLLEKQIPMLAHVNFGLVDVRDVAAAHIAGMTVPEAVGKRHILCAGNMWIKEMAECLVKEFQPQGYNIPTKVAPYAILWLMARIDKTVRVVLPTVGKVTKLNNQRMVSVLGVTPRPMEDTLIEMCYSMIEGGKIKKTSRYKGATSK